MISRALLAGLLLVLGSACTRVIVVEAPPRAPAPAGRTGDRTADRPADRTGVPVEGVSPRAFAEVRATWVVRTSLDSPEEIRTTVREAAAAGFNTLLVQVRGRGDAYFTSRIEPRADRLRGSDFDPLDVLIDEAHRSGISVHAWVVAHLVWGIGDLPDDANHIVNVHPDWLAVPRELADELWGVDPFSRRYVERLHAWTVAQEGRVEGLFVNPALPAVRRRLADVARDIAERYAVDGIHLDYIRYPSPEFDYSRAALEAFAGWMRGRVSEGVRAQMEGRVRTGDRTAWATAYPDAFADFRREQVTRAVEDVRAALRPVRREVVLSAAVFADPVDARVARYQDWPEWLRLGLVDVAAPMAYTADESRYRDLLRAADEARTAAPGSEVWMGLGVYQDTFDGAIRKLSLVREAGFRGAVVFSWDWARWEAPAVDGRTWLDAFGSRAFRRGR